MTPYRVLESYYPQIMPADRWNQTDGWRCWSIGQDLTELTHRHGLKPFHDPLHTAQNWTPWNSQSLHAEVHKWHPGTHVAEGFHQDGDMIPGAKMDFASVLWASTTPTEFNYQGKIYQPKPFEVVLFRNLSCSHRRPSNAPEARFFFHQCVSIPHHMEIP